MIGDSENDVLSARAAGCRVIVVETGYNEGRPVSELDADAIVPGLLDAARLIEPPHASLTQLKSRLAMSPADENMARGARPADARWRRVIAGACWRH